MAVVTAESFEHRHDFTNGDRHFVMPAYVQIDSVDEPIRPPILHIPGYGDEDHALMLLRKLGEREGIPGVSLVIPFHKTPHQIADSGQKAVERVARELVPNALVAIGEHLGTTLQVVTSSIGSAIAGFGLQELEGDSRNPLTDLALINPAGLAYGPDGRIARSTLAFFSRYSGTMSSIKPGQKGVRIWPLAETLAKDALTGPSRFWGQLAVINTANFGDTFAEHAQQGHELTSLAAIRIHSSTEMSSIATYEDFVQVMVYRKNNSATDPYPGYDIVAV